MIDTYARPMTILFELTTDPATKGQVQHITLDYTPELESMAEDIRCAIETQRWPKRTNTEFSEAFLDQAHLTLTDSDYIFLGCIISDPRICAELFNPEPPNANANSGSVPTQQLAPAAYQPPQLQMSRPNTTSEPDLFI